jgi:uncharacterized membrane protein YfcA
MPAMAQRSRFLWLAAIATGAGAFSGLFGVGGETIMIGLLAAIAQTIYGNVDYAKGIPIGIPAVGG